jgi:hypothetical protein
MTPVTFQKHLEQQDTRAAGSPPGVLMPRAMAKNAGIDSEEARLQAKSLPQKTAGRNDRHDIDPRELKLLRVGHYLWAIYKKECGKSGNVSQQGYGDPRLDQLIRAREHTRRMREQGELRRPARRMDKGLEERMKKAVLAYLAGQVHGAIERAIAKAVHVWPRRMLLLLRRYERLHLIRARRQAWRPMVWEITPRRRARLPWLERRVAKQQLS